MRYSLVLLMLFCLSDALAFERLKGGDKDKCAKAESYINSMANTNLEQAYYFSKFIFCARKQQFRELTRKEWFSSNYYLENITEVNKLISNANYEQEGIDLVFEMHDKFYLTPNAREVVTKALLKAVEANPDYWSSDEHPYIRHKLETDKYGLMAMSYYSSGMKDDGLRILNELRTRPMQYEPEIDKLQVTFERGYEKWLLDKNKEEVAKEARLQAETKKLVASSGKGEDKQSNDVTKSQVNTEIPSAKLEEAPINKNSLFILALIIIFALFFYSRRKGKN